MSNKNGLSAVSCLWFLFGSKDFYSSWFRVGATTHSHTPRGWQVSCQALTSEYFDVGWLAVYGSVDGEKLRLGLDEENVVLGSGLWVVGGSLEPPKFWL